MASSQLTFFVKIITVVHLLLFCICLHAQTIWEGGTPGFEQDWNQARNWNIDRVPGEFDEVIIPNVTTRGHYYSVIENRIIEIASLFIQSGANLTIKPLGILSIDGETTYNYGIYLQGQIFLEGGQVDIRNTGLVKILLDENKEIFDSGNI